MHDIVRTINGVHVSGQSMDYVAELLSGDPGSVCEISLYRGKAQRLARFFGGWDLECVLPVRL